MDTAPNAADFHAAKDDVFARIARRYDLLCDLFSLGAHRLWKSHMAKRLAERRGDVLLDLASGTGDIPQRLLRRRGAPKIVLVTDLSPSMLALAREKLGDDPGCRFSLADAEALAGYPDGSVDLVSISFGMKICDRRRVATEALRVLKPGGGFFCLEAARMPWPWLHKAYLAYMGWCLPMIAALAVDGDRGAYDYLLRGIHEFPDQASFAAELAATGFSDVRYENLTFGIVALHMGVKPNS